MTLTCTILVTPFPDFDDVTVSVTSQALYGIRDPGLIVNVADDANIVLSMTSMTSMPPCDTLQLYVNPDRENVLLHDGR